MKFTFGFLGALFAVALLSAPFAHAQSEPDIDGKEVEQQLDQREQNIQKLSTEEQLKLRAAQVKSAEDPAVLAALEKRNEAIKEFRMALRNSIIKVDPKMEAILDKIAVGSAPGF